MNKTFNDFALMGKCEVCTLLDEMLDDVCHAD